MKTPREIAEHLTQSEPASDGGLELVYRQLHGLAAQLLLDERRDHTLQATALVHEAWIKVSDHLPKEREARESLERRFLALAARGMRQVLVDHARGKNRDKRGGDWAKVTFFEPPVAQALEADQVLDLEEAIRKLEERSPRLARLAELRLFTGLSVSAAADVLDISRQTANEDWLFARALLARWLDTE